MKTIIKLTEDAYVCGGSLQIGIVLLTEWYQASAEDDAGNEYRVLWELDEEYDPNTQEEDSACDWGSPFVVYDEDGRDVTDEVEID